MNAAMETFSLVCTSEMRKKFHARWRERERRREKEERNKR